MATRDGIAIIAVAGNFPANATAENYWERLVDQSAPIQRLPGGFTNWQLHKNGSRVAESAAFSRQNTRNSLNNCAPATPEAMLWAALSAAGYTGQRPVGRIAVFGELRRALQHLNHEATHLLKTARVVNDAALTPETGELLRAIPAEIRHIAAACWYLSHDFCDIAVAGGEIVLVMKRHKAARAEGDAMLAVIEELFVTGGGKDALIVTSAGDAPPVNRELIGISQNLPGKTLVYGELATPEMRISRPLNTSLKMHVNEPIWEDAPDINRDADSPRFNRLLEFTKLLFAMQHRQVPPGLWIRNTGDFRPGAVEKFHQNPESRAWLGLGNDRRGGAVFSFGNAAMQLTLTEAQRPAPGLPRHWQVVTFSGETEAERQAEWQFYREYLRQHSDVEIADLAYTLQTGRHSFSRRASLVVQDSQHCQRLLASPASKRMFSGRLLADNPGLAFMFPGAGAAYLGMAQEIYENEPFFAQRIDEYAENIRALTGVDICRVISPEVADFDEAQKLMCQPQVEHLALLAVEIALAKLWQNWGVQPDVLIGHDLGEIAALAVSGCFAPETAFAIAAERCRIVTANAAEAAIVARLTPCAAAEYLAPGVKIAAVQSSQCVTMSGAAEVIAQISQRLRQKNIWYRPIPGRWCSNAMPPVCEIKKITQIVENTGIQSPKIPVFSTLASGYVTATLVNSSSYWLHQVASPVTFADGVTKLFADDISVFLEIGPGSSLGSAVRLQKASPKPPVTVATMSSFMESRGDEYALLRAVARLWADGIDIDWESFYENESRRRLHLPVMIPNRLQVRTEP